MKPPRRKPRPRVTRALIVEEFGRGLSFVGIARKYGWTVKRVEETVRGWMR